MAAAVGATGKKDKKNEEEIAAEKAKGGGQFESQKALLSELFKTSFTGDLTEFQRTLVSISSSASPCEEKKEGEEEEQEKASSKGGGSSSSLRSSSNTTESLQVATPSSRSGRPSSTAPHSSSTLSFLSASQIHELSIHLKEYRDGTRKTALHFACAGAQERKVEILLGIDPSLVQEKDIEGETALFFLLRGDYEVTSRTRLAILKLLLQHKADVNERTVHGLTPLHIAAGEKGGKDFAQLLIQAGAHVDAISNHFGTPLQRAIIAGCRDTARYLLSVGANPDGGEALRAQSKKESSSPLSDTKGKGREEQEAKQKETSSLPELKETEKREENTGESPRSEQMEKAVGRAKDEGSEGERKVSEDQDPAVQLPPPPLVYASSIGDEDTVLDLIYAGADVDIKDTDGWTPLQCASEVGADACVIALLEAGANPKVITHGVTAFDLAVEHERLTTASILKDLTGGIAAAQLQEGIEGKAATDVSQRQQKTNQATASVHAQGKGKRREGQADGDFTQEYASEPNRQDLTSEEEEHVSEANRMKEEGNQFFAKKNFQKALDMYTKALEVCPRLSSTKRQRAALHCNSCLMLLELKQTPAKALEHAQRAIALDPEWQRGYYRAAQACRALNDPGEAAQQFWQALLRDPDNEDISREFRAAVAAARETHGQAKASAKGKVTGA
ncbi:tetratricopeptide repeat-containing protein [Cystoisospora suis]|uniref:Tetratricopeptide repeat-containing protein n=1 Tax=Cystoisospora suis TaxID=483139 RepID=A0A2C6KTL4_9APIC|nr:tetratricopeptide repeat-containing protein [Cystoisospora suis]